MNNDMVDHHYDDSYDPNYWIRQNFAGAGSDSIAGEVVSSFLTGAMVAAGGKTKGGSSSDSPDELIINPGETKEDVRKRYQKMDSEDLANSVAADTEYFNNDGMLSSYNSLTNVVNQFCNLNKEIKEEFALYFHGGFDSALVGLPAAHATKSWSDNVGAMEDLEEALRAYANSELAILKNNIETVDGGIRDTFSGISQKYS